MFTPFDTAHMTHRAERHIPADEATRDANRQLRATQRAAWWAFVGRVLAAAPCWRTTVKPISSRV